MLVASRNAEEAENHCHDEHVVHRQRFLDQKAGVVLQRAGRAHLVPDPATEGEGDADISGGQPQTFADADFPMATVQDAEVEGQQGNDEQKEAQPEPRSGTEKLGEENSLQCMHDTLRTSLSESVTPTWRLSTVRGARRHW
ncbi:hypothetical protein D3C84_988580 [compost metagenome]